MKEKAKHFEVKAAELNAHYKKEAWQTRKGKINSGGRDFYRYLRNDFRGAPSVLLDDEGKPTTDMPTIQRIFKDTWERVYNVHKHSKPDFKSFAEEYKQFFPTEKAPQQNKGPHYLH